MTLLSTHHHNHKGNKQVFQWFWDLDNISEPFQHHVETSTKLPLKNFIDRDPIEGLKPKFIFLTTHNMEEPTNITLAKLFKTTCGIGSEKASLICGDTEEHWLVLYILHFMKIHFADYIPKICHKNRMH